MIAVSADVTAPDLTTANNTAANATAANVPTAYSAVVIPASRRVGTSRRHHASHLVLTVSPPHRCLDHFMVGVAGRRGDVRTERGGRRARGSGVVETGGHGSGAPR